MCSISTFAFGPGQYAIKERIRRETEERRILERKLAIEMKAQAKEDRLANIAHMKEVRVEKKARQALRNMRTPTGSPEVQRRMPTCHKVCHDHIVAQESDGHGLVPGGGVSKHHHDGQFEKKKAANNGGYHPLFWLGFKND